MSTSTPRPSLPGNLLVDTVFEKLLAQLLDGDLAPGSQLSIEGTARALGVSATPVREALARIESTGLVKRTARRGYHVAAHPSDKEIADLIDVRLAVEPLGALHACLVGGSSLVAALEKAVRDLAGAPHGTRYEDYRAYLEADERFHTLIAQHSGNATLVAVHEALGGLARRFRHQHGVTDDDAHATVDEHAAITSAFRLQNPDLARDEMIRHLTSVKARARIPTPPSGRQLTS